MKWLLALVVGTAVLTASADTGSVAAVPHRPAYSYLLPNWRETTSHPAPLATVRENNQGFTQIDFRWRAAPNGIDSRLQQQVWEDGESYIVFDKQGKRIFCTCEGDASPEVVFTRTANRDIYYFIDDEERLYPPMKYGEVPYDYTFFAMSRGGYHYYQCVFSSRLSSVVPRALLRTPLPASGGNEIPLRIATFLSAHGADMVRDQCEEIDFKR